MNEFRGPLPLNDRDFAEIRARVMEKIERPSRRRFVVPAFAAAAVAVIVFLLIPHRVAVPTRTSAPVAKLPGSPVAPTLRQPGNMETRQPDTHVAVASKPQRPQKPKPILVASKGSPPSDRDIVMEIHTADPDVRIIWIGSR